jgi:hypothetical protein
MSTDLNELLAGAGLNKPITPVDPFAPQMPPQPALPAQAGTFDPQTVQAMLALHGQRNQMATIDRQRKLADQLRADASGLMGTKQVGRVAVGPKWYDALANVAANAEGMRQNTQANESAAGLDKSFGTTMQKIIDEYNAKLAANR